jgi:hypothetical protein
MAGNSGEFRDCQRALKCRNQAKIAPRAAVGVINHLLEDS